MISFRSEPHRFLPFRSHRSVPYNFVPSRFVPYCLCLLCFALFGFVSFHNVYSRFVSHRSVSFRTVPFRSVLFAVLSHSNSFSLYRSLAVRFLPTVGLAVPCQRFCWCYTFNARGISAAVHGRPASVLVTDLNVETMANLAHNVELNRHRYPAASEVSACVHQKHHKGLSGV